MKKYLVAGLLVWVPIVVTIIVIRFVLELMDGMLLVLPIDWRPEHLVGFKIPGIGLILALLVLFITGVLAANFLGKKLLYISEHFFSRIPLVRTIYKVVKQSMNVILSPKSNLIANPEKAKFCYFANMHNIFPNDRGQNRSFYLAKKIANRIYKELIYSSK